MDIHVSRTWTPTPDEWDRAWLSCPYSTYFHGRQWAEVWSKYHNHTCRPAPIAFQLSNGLRVLFPLTQEHCFRGAARRYLSSPAGTFGGWLADKHLTAPEQLPVIAYIRRHFPNLTWRFNPYAPIAAVLPAQHLVADDTHTLDLSVGLEAVYKGWKKGELQAVRQARNAGVTITLARTEHDWESYYQTYLDTHRRWGAKARGLYSWRLFAVLYRIRSSHVKLWLAHRDSTLLAGLLCVYSPNVAAAWHDAALSSHLRFRPVQQLMYVAMENAAHMGCRWFDLNPSGGLQGVRRLKTHLGGKPKSSNVYVSVSPLHALLGKVSSVYGRLKRRQAPTAEA